MEFFDSKLIVLEAYKSQLGLDHVVFPNIKGIDRTEVDGLEPGIYTPESLPEGNERDWSKVGYPPKVYKSRPTKRASKNKTSVLGDLDPYNAYDKNKTVVAKKKKDVEPKSSDEYSSGSDDASGSEADTPSDMLTESDESDVDSENDTDDISDDLSTESGSEDDDDDESEDDSSDETVDDSEEDSTDSDDDSDSDDSDDSDDSEDSDESDVTDESDDEDDSDDADDGDKGKGAKAANAGEDMKWAGNVSTSGEKHFGARLEALPTAVNLASSLASNSQGLFPMISAALFGGAMAYFPSAAQALMGSSLLQPPTESQLDSGLSRSSEPSPPVLQTQPEIPAMFSDWFKPSQHGLRNFI